MPWSLDQLDVLLPPVPATRPRSRQRRDVDATLLEPLVVPQDVPEKLLKRVTEAPVTASNDKEKRSGQAFAMVMMCLIEGWQAGTTLSFLLEYNHRPSVSRRGRSAVAEDVARIYEKHPHVGRSCLLARCADATAPLAKAAVAPHDPAEPVVVTLARFLSAVDAHPWKGQAGRSSAAILQAHVELAERCGSLTYDASSRELAPLAGVDRKTVEAHHSGRLIPGGWLKLTGERRRRLDAQRYTLLLTHLGPHQSQGRGGASTGLCGPNQSRSDVFRYGRGGLGKTAGALYDVVHDAPCSAEDAASQAGCARRTGVDKLRLLERYGAVKNDHGVWRALEPDWAALADRLGVRGRTDRQRARHEQERRQARNKQRGRQRVLNAQEEHLIAADPHLADGPLWAGWEAARALREVERQMAERRTSAQATQRVLDKRGGGNRARPL